YLFARVLLAALTSAVFPRLPQYVQDDTLNRVLGIIPGAVNGLISAALISVLLLALPFSDGLSAKTQQSATAGELSPHVAWAEDRFAPVFDKAVQQSINRLTVDPSSEKSVDLPFSVKAPRIREELEAEMLRMVNEERAKEGLQPLKPDPEMQAVARAHSR